MSAFTKSSDETIRNVTYALAGLPPLEQFSGPKFDPQRLSMTVTNGILKWVTVTGPAYKQDGKLGVKIANRTFAHGEPAPSWLAQVLAHANVELAKVQ